MRQSKNDSRKVHRFVAVAALAIATLSIISAGRLDVQAQISEGIQPEPEPVVQAGTYDPEQAFAQYPGREKLMETYQSALPALQKAQQEGDEKKALQLQQELSQKRDQIVKKFQNDVQQALPDIAKATGVQLVALQVVYTGEGVKTKDITPQVVEAIGGDPDEQTLPVPPRE